MNQYPLSPEGANQDPPPVRWEAGPLGGWLRDALSERLEEPEARRVLSKADVWYARRRAQRKALGGEKPVLETEVQALRDWLTANRADLRLQYQVWLSLDAALRRRLEAWVES